ncbi:NAD(P)H-dependent oxidoreductase subunit E [Candidatus Methylocalor cossyra]|uniref:NADH-quinone oxidoreductase subunit F n=1 Tax=Candidatus Methylocalor cossyra TaxID=3108543 RepID=A0ABM9NKX8_9GAMM
MALSAAERIALDDILARYPRDPAELVQILRAVQERFRHVPRAAMQAIATALGIPLTQVEGVTEFYAFLSTAPVGRYDLRYSDSITDHMLGSRELASYLCQRLGVQPGETRADGKVSFAFTSCTGMCDQGPAALVNGRAVTRLDRARVDAMAGLIEAETPLAAWPPEFFQVEDNIRKAGPLLGTGLAPGAALRRALEQGAEALLAELELSGLRGRGGAGFNTAMKWRFCREGWPDDPAAPQRPRYVVCNADEGEPGTFKDRVLLNSYAHAVFEGMTVCAAVVGARQGFLYLRGEYAHLQEALQNVLDQRRRLGLLGQSILGRTGFDFDIRIHLGAGAYICGEESALIESLEGKRGNPRNRPPYPVTHGYRGQPTVVNNVETFVAAAHIALTGGAGFAALGTAKSKGTKLLSISGDCARPGIYEYPFGTRVADILADCGASEPLGVQVGGPSGTFVAPREFDRRLAFEDLATGGSFIVFDRSRDLLAIARNFTHFFAHESCGFCTPCRVGTALLRDTLDKICAGHGTPYDLVELTRLAKLVKNTSHCGLGQTAANPVLSTLERFPDLYQARLGDSHFEPGFDLDGALEVSRRLTGRDDPYAHLAQMAED